MLFRKLTLFPGGPRAPGTLAGQVLLKGWYGWDMGAALLHPVCAGICKTCLELVA